jgi:hypothetical protein
MSIANSPVQTKPEEVEGDVADHCRRVHSAIHDEPWFIGGLDHRFSRVGRRQWAEYG